MSLRICRCGHFRDLHDYLGCVTCNCSAYDDMFRQSEQRP